MFVAGMVLSLIYAIIVWVGYKNSFFTGLYGLITGCLGSWIGSFFTYGFGELIERTSSIDDKLSNIPGTATPGKDDSGSEIDRSETWTCSNCQTINPKSRIDCRECGTVRY